MKILFVLKLEVNPKVGGVERVTHVLARYFLNAGIQVNFFYFQLMELSFPEYHKNMEVFFSPDISHVNSNANILFLKNLLINNGIDIIINQGNIGNSITDVIARAAKGTGVKIISVLHSRPFDFTLFWGQYKQTLSNHLSLEKKTVKNILKKRFLILFGYNQYVKSYKKYLKTALVTSDRLVLLSRGYIPLLKKILNVEISPKLIAIANPLSFEHHFTPNEMNDKKNQVLYVGRLEYHAKRLDRLINAWSLIENNVPGWKLIIVGGSVDKVVNENDYQVIEWRRLKAMTESLQLKNIIFAGNKNPEPYYRESKLFCLTSSYEGFPLVLGEAMQCGVVPVAFGSFAAVKDIINHKVNGLIATPFDISEYAAFVSELMINEAEREKMAVNGIRDSKKFSLEVIAHQWIELFKELTV